MTRTWIVLGLAGILPALGSTRPASAHATPCNLIARTPQESEWFGFALAAQGSRLAVGAPGDPGAVGQGSGAVYVFRRSDSGWSQEARLRTDGAGENRFGTAVALQGDRLAVGAPAAIGERVPGAGAVYVFSRSSGSWVPETPARVTAPDGARGDRFGAAVAIAVDILVVGAPFDGDAGSLSGSVYVFRRSGNQWGLPQKLRAPDGQSTDQFGAVVAMEGDRLVVGAPFADELPRRRNSGAVYVFQWNGERWTFQEKLKPPGFEEDDVRFGSSVAIAGGLLVVGAPGDDRGAMNRGVAYVFRAEGSGWSQPLRLTPVDSDGEAGDQTGSAVVLGGNTLVVGAPFHRNNGVRAGAVFRFSGSGTTWTEISPPLTGMEASSDDRFGSSVAISDRNEILFGGPLDDVNGQTNAGSVAVCPLGGPTTADLSIEKSGQPDPVCVGGSLTYGITVSNHGPDAVTGARVTDDFPNDLRVQWECSGRRGASCVASGEGDIDQLVDLPVGGEVRYTVTAIVEKGSDSLSNIAHVEAPTGVMELDLLNNSTPAVTTTVSAVDLALMATDPTAVCGGELRYTLTVTNRGEQAADNVEVMAETPPGLTPLPPPGCGTSPAGHIVCPLGRFPAGRSVVLTVAFEIPECFSGDAPIRATVSTVDFDCDPLNDEVVDALFSIDCSTVLGIEKTGSTNCGTSISYPVKITNLGPNRACNVVLSDPTPSGLSSPVPPPGCELTANEIRCPIGSLEPAEMRSFELRFTVPPDAECGSKITNTATVSADNAATVSANAMTTVACCKLAISKEADVATAMPGQRVFYTIKVSNPSDCDVTATVEDDFPAELNDIRWCRDEGFPCTPKPAGNLLDTVLLPAGGSATYRASGNVDVKFTGTLANTASVSAPECEGAAATEETEIAFTGVKAFCIRIEGQNVEGGMITYTFLLINGGPAFQADNPGDEFKDTLPAGLTLTGASADSGTAATAGNMATWNGSIPVGGMVMITVTATIDAGTEGMTICNQAMIAFDADGNGTNESAGLSDDPSQPGDADPCCFQVLSALPIPALSTAGLAALVLLLVALAWRRLRARGA